MPLEKKHIPAISDKLPLLIFELFVQLTILPFVLFIRHIPELHVELSLKLFVQKFIVPLFTLQKGAKLCMTPKTDKESNLPDAIIVLNKGTLNLRLNYAPYH